MCGIAGFIDLWDSREARALEERKAILDRMCRIIRHRGPDDQGVMVKAGVALGMRRLSIIDLVSGHQPISGEDGSVTLSSTARFTTFRNSNLNSKRTATRSRRILILKRSFMPTKSLARRA